MKKLVIALATAGFMAAAFNAQARTGEEIYNTTCANCHGPATAAAVKAPLFGSKEEWAPRIAKGMDAMYETAFNGSKVNPTMLPRGTCADCTDDELKAAVDHMVNAAK